MKNMVSEREIFKDRIGSTRRNIKRGDFKQVQISYTVYICTMYSTCYGAYLIVNTSHPHSPIIYEKHGELRKFCQNFLKDKCVTFIRGKYCSKVFYFNFPSLSKEANTFSQNFMTFLTFF
jgi:hypothetical protein